MPDFLSTKRLAKTVFIKRSKLKLFFKFKQNRRTKGRRKDDFLILSASGERRIFKFEAFLLLQAKKRRKTCQLHTASQFKQRTNRAHNLNILSGWQCVVLNCKLLAAQRKEDRKYDKKANKIIFFWFLIAEQLRILSMLSRKAKDGLSENNLSLPPSSFLSYLASPSTEGWGEKKGEGGGNSSLISSFHCIVIETLHQRLF